MKEGGRREGGGGLGMEEREKEEEVGRRKGRINRRIKEKEGLKGST